MPYAPNALPYCGAPPVPGSLWQQWNLDPILIAILMAVAVFYGYGRRLSEQRGKARAAGWTQPIYFYTGWLIATLAFISPLCALSVALFSARVGQHMILVLVAAPLIMLGRPEAAFAAIADRARFRAGSGTVALLRVLTGSTAAWIAFAVPVWFWHAPGPYAATFEADWIYWAMHITLFGSSLLLWRTLIGGDATQHAAAIVSGFTTSLHMGLLGALITLAPRAVYEPHASTTWTWGLGMLEDQQLGGVIMWVPGGGLFLAAGLLSAAALLRTLGERHTPALRP